MHVCAGRCGMGIVPGRSTRSLDVMIKTILFSIVGLILAPFLWLLQRIGVLKAPPKLPGAFEALSNHLFLKGVSAVGEAHSLTVNNVRHVVAFRLGFDPTKFYVV